MKKFIALTIVLVSITCTAQLHVQGGMGLSAQAGKLVLELESGYTYKHITVAGGFDAHTGPMVDRPTMFFSTLGYSRRIGVSNYVSVSGGITRHLYTTDVTKEYSPNTTTGIGKLLVGREIMESNCFVYLSYTQTKGYSLFTIGLRGVFE